MPPMLHCLGIKAFIVKCIKTQLDLGLDASVLLAPPISQMWQTEVQGDGSPLCLSHARWVPSAGLQDCMWGEVPMGRNRGLGI